MAIPYPFPSYVTARAAEEAIVFCGRILRDEEDCTDLDASGLRFVDPLGIALLGSTFHRINKLGGRIRIHGMRPEIAGYLQRMDLFSGVELVDYQLPEARRHDRSNALVELLRLDDPKEVDGASGRLAQAVVGRIPGIDPLAPADEMTGFNAALRLEEPIRYALCELLENALTHARAHGNQKASVWVVSQYYPTKKRIQIGVVDNGCGFLQSLRSHPDLRSPSDLHAILLALRPRISCNRDLLLGKDSVNQGVGLTTADRIARKADGGLVIASGEAIYNTAREGSSTLADGERWQGVAIAWECFRERLDSVRFRDLLPPRDPLSLRPPRFED